MAAVAALAGEALEVDCDLGGEHVEPDRRPAAAAKNDLRGEEVRPVLTVAASGGRSPSRSLGPLLYAPVCQSRAGGADLLHSL